jgi:transcriptional antiterminator RfaH
MQSQLADKQWYALRVRPRFEKVAAFNLERKGYEQYFPIFRKAGMDRLLFPGYLFTRFNLCDRTPVLLSPGVISIVSSGGSATAIGEQEIAALQRIIQSGLDCEPSSLIGIGRPVFVERGPLIGLTGFGLAVRRKYRLIMPVRVLQRSVSIEIDRKCVRHIDEPGRHHTAFAS